MTDSIRRYECSGTLDHGDGTPPIACECEVTQDHDGTIRLRSRSSSPEAMKWTQAVMGPPIEAAVFEGQTNNGLPVRAEGRLIGMFEGWGKTDGARATFDLTGKEPRPRLTVGSAATADWRFAITNLVFDVPLRWQGAPTDGRLSFALGENVVTLERVSDYKAAKQQLRGPCACWVTAEVGVPASVPFEAACDLVDDLCSVLSIARGTIVNWIFCEQRDSGGLATFASHHPAVTGRYNGALPLIDPRRPDELPSFVQGVFARFRELKDAYKLSVIARACADVRTDGFLETRSLQLLSTLEYMIGRNATLRNREYIMDDQAFLTGLGRLKPVVGEVLRLAYPALGKQEANRMIEHLRGLNYTTFKRRLREAAANFGVQLDQTDVEALAETRNALVHRGAFFTDREMAEFQRIQWVMDRYVMGLLGYPGPYIDARTFERAAVKTADDPAIE